MAKGKIFGELPKWAQGFIAVTIVAGSALVIYKVYKEIEREHALKGSKAESKDVKSQLSSLNKNASTKQTLSASQLDGMANKLQSAMDGYGTDNKAVMSVFANVKNDADVLALIQAYGIRKLSSGKLNPTPDFEGGLGASLSDELPQSSNAILDYGLIAINPVVGLAGIASGDASVDGINKILEAKKIKYRF